MPSANEQNPSALIERGLLSDDAKVWDEAENLKREENMQKILSSAMTAVSVSIDEDSEDYSTDDCDSPHADSNVGQFNHNTSMDVVSNYSSDVGSHIRSEQMSDLVPQAPPAPFTINSNSENSNIEPLVQAHIQSLELQVSHLYSQNQSLRNTIIRDRQTLEQLSFSNSQTMEQLNLLKAHFQHLLPPPSTASDPSMSNSTCILPPLPELRGEALHKTKIELEQAQKQLQLTLSQITEIKEESNNRVQILSSKNTALQNQIEFLQTQLTQQNHINNQSQRQIQNNAQDQSRIEKHLEKQLHVLQGQIFTLKQEGNERKLKEAKYVESITNLKRNSDQQLRQLNTLKIQSKKDQTEIASLLEDRNALRGQLDEIQLHASSLSKKNATESEFQIELQRIQSSHLECKKKLQEQVSSMEIINTEQKKLLQETKLNEASSLQQIQELRKGCQLLIKTLLGLEQENLLFNGKRKNLSVKDMVMHAWEGLNHETPETFLADTSMNENCRSGCKECQDVSIQTTTGKQNSTSCGINTDNKITLIYEEQKELDQHIQNLARQNKNLNDSNLILKKKLQNALDISNKNTNSDVELHHLTQENITLTKSKLYMQEENRKLVEKRVFIENLYNSSLAEKCRLTEKLNYAESENEKKKNQLEEKLKKLRKEMNDVERERHYWENKAEELVNDQKCNSSTLENGEGMTNNLAATVSFDQSTNTSQNIEGSFSLLVTPREINKHTSLCETGTSPGSPGNFIEKYSNKVRSLSEHNDLLKASLTEKESIIRASTDHLKSSSLSINSSYYPSSPAQEDDDLPLEKWIETWESNMDHHIKETFETVTEEVSSDLNLLVNNKVQMRDDENETTEENEEDCIEDSMDKYVEDLALNMVGALQEGLEMLQNSTTPQKQQEVEENDHRNEGDVLQNKLKMFLRRIDEHVSENQESGFVTELLNNRFGSDIDEQTSKKDVYYLEAELQSKFADLSGRKVTGNVESLAKIQQDIVDVKASVANGSMTKALDISSSNLSKTPQVATVACGSSSESIQTPLNMEKSDTGFEKMMPEGSSSSMDVSNKDIQVKQECSASFKPTESLQDKLVQFLQNIDCQKSFLDNHIGPNVVGVGTDTLPQMVSRSDRTMSYVKGSENSATQTSANTAFNLNDINSVKKHLSIALSQCSQLETEKKILETVLTATKQKFDDRLHMIQHEKEDELKFLQLHLESTLSMNRNINQENKENESTKLSSLIAINNPLQERLYRIRQSSERAALIAKHEEEQAALISECNAALRTKMETFNHEVSAAVEKNLEEVKRDRDEFVKFAFEELKKEYNDRIEKLLVRHQQEIVQAKADSSTRLFSSEEDIYIGDKKVEGGYFAIKNVSKQTNSQEESMGLLNRNYSSLKNIMKPKEVEKKGHDLEEDHTEYNLEDEKNHSDQISMTPHPSQLLKANDLAVNVTTSPLNPNCAANLFKEQFESQISADEESFQEVEDFVMSVLSNCVTIE